MKKLMLMTMMACLGLFAAGCSDETQLENAQEDLYEERVETQETILDATRDGVVTPSDRADILEERADDMDAKADVVDQAGDVMENRIDN